MKQHNRARKKSDFYFDPFSVLNKVKVDYLGTINTHHCLFVCSAVCIYVSEQPQNIKNVEFSLSQYSVCLNVAMLH